MNAWNFYCYAKEGGCFEKVGLHAVEKRYKSREGGKMGKIFTLENGVEKMLYLVSMANWFSESPRKSNQCVSVYHTLRMSALQNRLNFCISQRHSLCLLLQLIPAPEFWVGIIGINAVLLWSVTLLISTCFNRMINFVWRLYNWKNQISVIFGSLKCSIVNLIDCRKINC